MCYSDHESDTEFETEVQPAKKKKVESESFVENDIEGIDDILNSAYDQNIGQIEGECSKKCDEKVEKKVEKRALIPENMVHLVQNTKKEIKRNHLLAKIRYIEKNKVMWSAKFKVEMSEYFPCIESWPNYAIELLLSRDFGYHDRIGFACFLHGNLLRDADKAMRIFQIYNRSWTHERDWTTRFLKFQALFTYLDEYLKPTETGARIRENYWYYCLNLRLYVFYDGSVRMKDGTKRRYKALLHYNK